MTVDLKAHIQQKFENQQWLADCLEGKPASFPYRPNPKGKADIGELLSPRAQSDAELSSPNNDKPRYVVNIPMGQLPSKTPDYTKYTSLLQRVRDESFGVSPRTSAPRVKDRVAVVLGINQIKSIDRALNRQFKKFVQALPKINDVVCRTFGFLWKPQWVAVKKGLYPLEKAFFILKALDPKKAEEVRKEHEQPKGLASGISEQIPFQKIRETIKRSEHTLKVVKQMERKAPDAPIYFTMMDADCKSLRGDNRLGIFSRLDRLIEDHESPSIASLGYSLDDNELPILRLAVKMDMAVRETMPMPYFPEPLTAVKVRRPDEPNFLNKLSFVGTGRSLESRRFIDSGRKELTDGAVFKGDGGVVTTTPGRMKTNYNTSVGTLTPAILRKKQTLQALRGRTIQTHAFPKQWADIFYAGLSFSTPQVTDATGPMMHIFNVYDPISRMFDGTVKYTPAVFDRVMRDYKNPLTAGQTNLLTTARGRLLNLGMKKTMIDLIEQTAKRSGAAIHQTLESVG